MIDIAQGESGGAELPEPLGSGHGFRRPVVVVRGDTLNRGRISSVVCVPLTGNLGWTDAPRNIMLPTVANALQIVPLDRRVLVARVRRLAQRQMALVIHGIDTVLGR